MAREAKARTKGTAFVKIVKKDEDGNWTDMVLVHNLAKMMPDKTPKLVGWGMPGGGVREDEDEYVGGLRETFEETNALANVAKKLLEDFRRSRPDEDMEYLEYMDDPEVLRIKRFEKMPDDLNALTKTIENCKEGQDQLRDAVMKRDAIIREYAALAKQFGLIKMIGAPKQETGRDGGTHLVWLFEMDAADRVNADNLHWHNDLAKTVDGVTWATREHLEDRGRNFKHTFGRPDYIYVSHLQRLGLIL